MPAQADEQFNIGHEAAFRALGARVPVKLNWSAFDVSLEDARRGKASLLVTTIWNIHSKRDARRGLVPTDIAIAKDNRDGTLWYHVSPPPPGASTVHVAHWNRLQLAIERGIPIVGVLKDVHTRKCSLSNIFDCPSVRHQHHGKDLWLQLMPRGAIGADVRPIDIRELTGSSDALPDAEQLRHEFDLAVDTSLRDTSTERRARLANAPRVPAESTATVRVFDRNPDVVAEVLARANGVCEACNMKAPFTRKTNGKPYLEVHHRVPLAKHGEDTVDNAIALCPNCHREKHYG